jgi:catechol 2,3-dioxygenase
MTSTPRAQLTHLGIFVHDSAAMTRFYTGMFGMIVSDGGEFAGKHLTFLTGTSDEHHQVVLVEGRDGAPTTKVLSQVSFRVDSLADLRTFAARSVELGATELEARNHGNSWSIYFRDPEHNVIEMYVVTPWQVHQPWRVSLDLDLPDDQIASETHRLITDSGAFVPVDDWTRDVDERLRAHRAGVAGDAAS